MPEWLIQALAIIGASAIVAAIIYGFVKLALAFRQRNEEIEWLKNRFEYLKDQNEIIETEIEGLKRGKEMIWKALDDINKRLRDAEKEA